jgi:autotransporter translocation and assembly factor TamB
VARWEPQLRSELQKRAGSALGARVQIASISVSFFLRFSLKDVEIWDTRQEPETLLFRAKEVALTASFLDLPRALVHRNPLESIGQIEVDTPVVALTPEWVRSVRFEKSSSATATPLWFAVKWADGTFQWKDERAPHGAWTLYRSNGFFKIRGPRTETLVRGAVEEAESVNLHLTTLGRRWNAEGRLASARIPSVLTMLEGFLKRPLLPATWKADGRFDVDIQAGGRQSIKRTSAWASLIKEARVKFSNATLDLGRGPHAPPLQLNGSLVLKKNRLQFSHFSVGAENTLFKVAGFVLPFAAAPQIDVQAHSPKVDLSLVSRYGVGSSTRSMPLSGIGDCLLSVKGSVKRPMILLQLKVPEGHLWKWPFQAATIQIRGHSHQWEVDPSSLKIWDGRLSVKGHLTAGQASLQLTGEELSLPSASLLPPGEMVKGRLNFSATAQGPADNLHTTGSFWANGFAWVRSPERALRGDFDITSTRFQLQGGSEDDAVQVRLKGARTPKLITLENLFIQLSEVKTVSVYGLIQPLTSKLRLMINARNISLADDIPFLASRAPTLGGHADLQGTFEGPFDQPVFKADVQSHNFKAGVLPATQASAAIRWTPQELLVDSFRIEPGYAGSYRTTLSGPLKWELKLTLAKAQAALIAALLGKQQPVAGTLSGNIALIKADGLKGTGSVNFTDGSIGKWTVPQGALRFSLKGRSLDLQRLSWVTSQGKAEFKGDATWELPPEGRTLGKIFYRGEGQLASVKEGSTWTIPSKLKGSINPLDQWSGELDLSAPAPRLQGKTGPPISGKIRWAPTVLHWEGFRWGPTLSSQGSLQFGDNGALNGQIKAVALDLAQWQTLFLTDIKEPAQGTLNGTLTLSGTMSDPFLQLTGAVKKGVWRAFRFETGVEGRWKNNSLEPLILDGLLQTGGRARFQGRVSLADETASGSLELNDFELKPIAESLSFPKPLEGKARGTFTVSGSLSQLRFAGHLEGHSITYGTAAQNPLKLQSLIMDVKLEPSAQSNHITRLSITQAIAKTQEEEIRLQPGSYVEFAGPREAKMKLGSEIRNLHLGVFTLFGGLDINGTWKIQPEGFALQGDLFTRSLFINDYQLEQGHVQASYYNRVLSFEPPALGRSLVTGTVDFQKMPQLRFKDFAVSGRGHTGLRLNGDIGPSLWNFTMSGEGLDLSTLGGLAGFPYPLSGSADTKIKGTGDFAHPNVEGTLDVRDGRAIGLDFKTGTATFAWQGQRMTFTKLQMSDPGRYTLTGTGVFPVAAKNPKRPTEDKTIDFTLRLIDSNLGLLQSVSKDVRSAEGSVSALVQVKGSIDAPQLKGSIRVKNGDVVGAHYIRHLRDFQLAADFDGNNLILSEFSGVSSKGSFKGGGRITFSGFEPKFYDLALDIPSSKGIEVTVPELAIPESPLAKKLKFLTQASQCDVKGKVTFKGPADAPVFTAQVGLSRGHFTFPPSKKNPPPPAFMEWVRRIIWDVDLRFSDDAWFENELVEANLLGNLAINGTSDKLRVDGGMDIAAGKISYLGVEFDIRQARFEIHSTDNGSNIVTTPYIRGIADSRVPTIDTVTGSSVEDIVTLTINFAPINEIKPQLRSSLDPGLAQDKLLARVSQLEMENLTPQERTYLYQQQMVRLIDTSLATPLARSVLKKTGLVDEVRVSRVINPSAQSTLIDPANPSAGQQDTATNLLAGTKYTVAKNLSSRLSLGYGVRFEQTLNSDLTNKLDLRSDVEMSYRFLSNIYLRGSFDLPNQNPSALPERKVTIEPHWRFGWWGNTNKPKPKPAKPETPATTK